MTMAPGGPLPWDLSSPVPVKTCHLKKWIGFEQIAGWYLVPTQEQ